jgi:phage minor structural protein
MTLAIKSVLTSQVDFTGEFPVSNKTMALWRFNETAPDSNNMIADASGFNRDFYVSAWSGTSASFPASRLGRFFRQNIINPTSEKTHLIATNDGGFFTDLGEKIVVGGWINPTTYSIGQTFIPIFNTRQGPGQPIFYVSLYQGRPRLMLYNASGTLIYDQSETPPITLKNNGWYFFASIIEVNNKQVQNLLCDRSDGAVWQSPIRSFTGELNKSCTADIVMGMHANTYYYAGGFDDWFYEKDSDLNMDDLIFYFKSSLLANGGDSSSDVDALKEAGAVLLKETDGSYPSSGILYTTAALCNLSGTGRVSVTSEYTAGITSISLVETSTSDDLDSWTAWQTIGSSGELQSPNKTYIRYRITLTTQDSSKTPKLLEIQLHDIPRPPYEKLGFARPVVLNSDGAWESVLDNAFDILVTSEVNGADILEFKLPFHDPKRETLDNEKQVQIVNDVYRIRTIKDEKSSDGKVVTIVYAEAAFYDLSFSTEKEARDFIAETPDAPMNYALLGTGWSVGNVTVTTKRTWQSTEKNALSILRATQNIHGGDLIFDSANRLVHLLTFGGTDSGALFSYKKNMKSIERVVDTRSLVTRLYVYGKDGMTFASINGNKEYVEDFSYSSEVRVGTLDASSFTNPYQMLEFANMRLSQYAKPRISYVLSAMDLSVLTGYEHETWKLGDIVTVHDKELNLLVKTRVVRRQYNLQEPWKTVLELSTKLRELGDSSAQWDKAADILSSTDVLDRQEVKDLVPFNHLRNSRADDGMTYWLNSGFTVDPNNGVSGDASFMAEGVLGMTKSLSQTVYPANRRSYTLSAQIASENLQKGTNGQVGIEVLIEYEDGTTETRLIELF